MALTLSTIRNTIYAQLREFDSTATSAYAPEYVNTKINTAQYNICSGMVIWPDNMPLKKLKLPFLFRQAFYQNIGSIALSANTTIGATTLTVTDTTAYPASGIIWVMNNIVTYTWKTPTTFTGVTGVAFAFLSGSRIYPLFNLPDDYMNTLSVTYNNAFPLEFVDEQEIYQIVNQTKGMNVSVQSGTVQGWYAIQGIRKAFYTIYQGLYLAPFYLDNSVGMFNLSYERLPTAMVEDADTTIITNDTIGLDAISHLAFAEILFERWEEQRWLSHLAFGVNSTRKLYYFYNRAWSEDQFGKSYRMQKGTWFNF